MNKLFLLMAVSLVCFIFTGYNAKGDVKGSIKILSPNGGEIWEVGKTYKIIWVSANLPKGAEKSITIVISRPIDKSTGRIESKILFQKSDNDGIEEWLIPEDFILGNDYKIQISCNVLKIPCPVDYSDKPFSIINQELLKK